MGGLSPGGTAVLVGDVVIVVLLVCGALGRASAEDQGDGMGQVVLPGPRPVRLTRTASFYLLFVVVSSILVGVLPGLGPAYDRLVGKIALIALGQPSVVSAYARHLDGGLRLVVIVDILCFAVALRASAGRRAMVAAHAIAFIVLSLCLDALVVAVSASSGLPTSPYAFASTVVNLGAAVLVMLRILATTLVLPRPTTVPAVRPAYRTDKVVFASALTAAVVVVLVALDALATRVAGPHPALGVLVLLGYPVILDGLYLFLMAMGSRPRPGPAPLDTPGLTVIIPAFNEEAGIALTLESIDQAAGNYGGPVAVILTDDGSTDRTAEIVVSVMDDFETATGELVEGSHNGKAAALNQALRRAKTEICVRVDADVVVAEDAFLPLPAWFANPLVGTVGALSLPRGDLSGWISRVRLFECLLNFTFARLAQQRADAVACIPGTFTAFRRLGALEVGGFVSGMNGEDADLTMQLGRLGYRAVVDPRIRDFEDVPTTLAGLREQRTRWNRAGTQVMARHSPLLAANRCPRTWFLYLRTSMVRVTALLRPLVYLHGLQSVILTPSLSHRIGPFLIFYVVSAAPTFLVAAVLAAGNGFLRQVGWLALWYPFTVVRRVFTLEGLLSLPTRPVRLRAGRLRGPAAARPAADRLPVPT